MGIRPVVTMVPINDAANSMLACATTPAEHVEKLVKAVARLSPRGSSRAERPPRRESGLWGVAGDVSWHEGMSCDRACGAFGRTKARRPYQRLRDKSGIGRAFVCHRYVTDVSRVTR